MVAALQLQHDAGLILSNLQVVGQLVTSLNRMSSEVMCVAFAHEPFPMEAVQFVAPSHRVLLFGDSGVLRYGCIYVSGRIQAFLVYLCVFQQLLGIFGFC